jgi:hypothetical protein
MMRVSVTAVIPSLLLLASCAVGPSRVERHSRGRPTFQQIVNEFLVERNGEVVLDVRKSDRDRWNQEMLGKRTPWIGSRSLELKTYRYIVIHEYDRYHAVQLDRARNVLWVSTTNVEGDVLDAPGP